MRGGPPRPLVWGLYTLLCFFDLLDGALARLLGQTSDFGALMDPIADKVFVIGVMTGMLYTGQIPLKIDGYQLPGIFPLILLLVMLSREFFVTGLRAALCARGSRVPSAGIAGKLKAWAQLIALGSFLAVGVLPLEEDFVVQFGWGALLLAVALTVTSGYGYWKQYRKT